MPSRLSSVTSGCTEFQGIDETKNRLDTLYYKFLSSTMKWHDLWQIVQELLLLSHGQDSVEWGLLVNKAVSTEHKLQQTVVSQRMITDQLASVGRAASISMTRGLLYISICARQRYEEYFKWWQEI